MVEKYDKELPVKLGRLMHIDAGNIISYGIHDRGEAFLIIKDL